MFTRRVFVSGLVATGATKHVGLAQALPVADWRQVSGTGAPGGRWDHTLSALPGTSDLLVTFGRDAEGIALDDVWRADRSDGVWERVNSVGPSPRFGHAVATDDDRGKLWCFGGQASVDTVLADLWAYDIDAGAWELVHDGSGGPQARYGTALVYDGERSLYLLYGFAFSGRFDDVWRFDLLDGTWEQVSIQSPTAPLRRCLHEAVWRSSTETILMYGGCSSGSGPCPQGDLWELDPENGEWREFKVNGPAGRMNPSLVIDNRTSRLVLMGGLTETGTTHDLWIGSLEDDGVSWQSVASGAVFPSARSSHDAVLSGGALYLFGGTGVDGVTGDLWRLKLPD